MALCTAVMPFMNFQRRKSLKGKDNPRVVNSDEVTNNFVQKG